MSRCRLILGCIVAMLLLPAAASASWGSHCTNHTPHCYALAYWDMGEASEQVEGLSSKLYTTSMNVSDWNASGENFVSNEEWAIFPSDHGYWVEAGQIAGGVTSSNNIMHWFYAWDNSSGLHTYFSPYRVEGYEWNTYTLTSTGKESWCATIGSTQVSCGLSGVPNTSKDVEVGMEAAGETEPENSGHSQPIAEHLNGNWYNWNEAEWWSESHTCVSLYEWIAGHINFSTC